MIDATVSPSADASQPPECPNDRPMSTQPPRSPVRPARAARRRAACRSTAGSPTATTRSTSPAAARDPRARARTPTLLGIDRARRVGGRVRGGAGGGRPAGAARCSRTRRVLVTAFVEGRHVTEEELREPAHAGQRSPAALQHDARQRRASCPSTFSAFRIVEAYAATARARGVESPDDYDARAQAREADREGAARRPSTSRSPATTTCWPATCSRDGDDLRIVDWEYAGMGDRYFDLGQPGGEQRPGRGRRGAACSRPTSASRPTRAGGPRCT